MHVYLMTAGEFFEEILGLANFGSSSENYIASRLTMSGICDRIMGVQYLQGFVRVLWVSNFSSLPSPPFGPAFAKASADRLPGLYSVGLAASRKHVSGNTE